MPKLYKRAFAVCLLAATVYTCIYYLQTQHTNLATDAPLSLEERKKKTPEDRARFAEERARFEYDMLKELKTGKIPEGIRTRAEKQGRRTPKLSEHIKGAGFSVTPRGPNNFGGRTRAIAFDRSDATNNTILAGGVSSGVFRTTNGGTSWTKVSSNSEIHNVTTIVQDPRAGFQNIFYYGTGEALGNSASLGSPFRGHGVWKSVDGGLSWTRQANSNTGTLETFQCADYIYRLAIDPTNGNIYMAIAGAVLRSTDGGSSWNTVIGGACSGSTSGESDIVISSTGQVYIAFAGDAGSALDGIWTSGSGNSGSYTRIAGNSTPVGWDAPGDYDRMVLALAPSNEDILYALYENDNSGNCGGTPLPEADLWMYDASGPSWTDLSANMPDETGCSSGNDPFAVQGGYDLCVAVKPDDPNTVFVGGTNVYRSTDGFSSTGNTTRIGGYFNSGGYALYPNHHPDVHFLIFAPGGSGSFDEEDVLFTGTDGGVHRGDITAGTVSWTSLNNDYITYQYYHAAIDPNLTSNTLIGGTQDNGTTETTAGAAHSSIFGGDGVAVGISNGGTYYFGTQNGNLLRGQFTRTAIRPSGSSSIFVTYFYLDPDNTEILYYAGGDNLYRTSSASTVTSASWDELTGVTAETGGNIRSLASSRSSGYGATDANRKLYIGTDDGEVFRLNDPAFTAVGTSPVDITPGAAGTGIVSSISVNPADDNEILVTYSNYGEISVFHTNNANNATPTWTNVEGNLNLPSYRSSLIVNSLGTTYYLVGTSVGLYCTQTLNGGSTVWSNVSTTDIGYSVVSQLALRPSDNFFVAGTHGNGMFMLQAPTTPSIAFNTINSSHTEATAATTSCRDYTDVTVSMVIGLAPTGAATVTISNTGTATEGVDYEILNPSKQLTFPDGATGTQDVNIRIYDDTNPESAETIILDFVVSGATDAVKASTNITHTLTINDDDLVPGSGVTVFSEDFESGITFGTLGSNNWARGIFNGTSGTSEFEVGAAGGMTGVGSAYISIDGGTTSSYDVNTEDDVLLKTSLIDATIYSDMTLNFDFRVEGDPNNDYGRLYYSFDGFNYNLIDGTTTAPYVNQGTAVTRTVNLPAALDNQTFFLGFRWTQDDDGLGTAPGFSIDNISVTTGFAPVVETVLNSTDEQYFGPFETVNYYDGGDLVATLKNNSAYDYGCTTVTIDRAGTGAAAAWSPLAGEELASKTLLITPTNNAPAVGQTYDLTLYYSQAEFDGWVANSDPTHTTTDFKIVKSTGAIQALTIGSTNASVNSSIVYAAYGTDHSFMGTFDEGFSGFGGGDIGSPTLPVEYVDFTAKQVEADVQLDWSTSLEINSDRFEIERSLDGISFQRIGTVASTGGADGETYRFFDRTPEKGSNIYRLRQVDVDGKYSYSSKVEVSFLPTIAHKISPNPFSDRFILSLSDDGNQSYEFELFDLNGKKVHQEILRFRDKVEREIYPGELPPGSYLYILRKENSFVSGKIIRY
ncbi:MAG: T9SS type A sorting domain-containing protein [Bacteroidia bacterium]|nr:T9SS type A sorting domain-containing protein [Bacteroidia bacterium]